MEHFLTMSLVPIYQQHRNPEFILKHDSNNTSDAVCFVLTNNGIQFKCVLCNRTIEKYNRTRKLDIIRNLYL